MKILGIDFGLTNFGLSFTEGRLVEPFGQLKIKLLSEALDQLESICRKNKIKKIVIGLPGGKLKNTVVGFSRQLEQRTSLPVIFQPEEFSSKEAVEKMVEINKPLKKRQQQEHMVAACIILQKYLDEQT